jgi:hypothetical protein
MSKEDNQSTSESTLEAIMYILVTIVIVALCWWSAPKLWGWWVRNWQAFNSTMSVEGDYYCQSLKKIVKAEPIFEDNGKHEDESYRVTYEDGSVGLIDQATMKSGYYCVSEAWVKSNKPAPKDWVLKP